MTDEHNPIPPDPEDGGGPDVKSDPIPPAHGDGDPGDELAGDPPTDAVTEP